MKLKNKMNRLHVFRLLNGMTQGELAAKLNISQSAISQIESNKRLGKNNRIKIELLNKIGFTGDINGILELDNFIKILKDELRNYFI